MRCLLASTLSLLLLLALPAFADDSQASAPPSQIQMLPPTNLNSSTVCGGGNAILSYSGDPASGHSAINCINGLTTDGNADLNVGGSATIGSAANASNAAPPAKPVLTVNGGVTILGTVSSKDCSSVAVGTLAQDGTGKLLSCQVFQDSSGTKTYTWTNVGGAGKMTPIDKTDASLTCDQVCQSKGLSCVFTVINDTDFNNDGAAVVRGIGGTTGWGSSWSCSSTGGAYRGSGNYDYMTCMCQ